MDHELYIELAAGCICSADASSSSSSYIRLTKGWHTATLTSLSVHSPDGSTFVCENGEMTSWPPFWKCHVKSTIRLQQWMHICLKNYNLAKNLPDPISNVVW